MRIAICDDMRIFVDELERIIYLCGFKGLEIYKFLNGKDLLKEIDEMDLVFLDIGMPEMDGFEVGKEIRKRGVPCHIVMASAYEYYKEVIPLGVLQYIVKPYQIDSVKDAILTAASTAPPKRIASIIENKTVNVFKNRLEYEVPQEDIRYVKAYSGYVKVCTEKNEFRKDRSLIAFANNLEADFFAQINRSIIVGLKHVKREESGKIILNDAELFLTRKYKKNFRKKYYNFLEKDNIFT